MKHATLSSDPRAVCGLGGLRGLAILCAGVALIGLGNSQALAAALVPEFQSFLDKVERGEPIVVAYLGGSITAGASTWPVKGAGPDGSPYDFSGYDQNKDSWRAQTYEWLRKRYEKTPGQFRQLNAAIGGTPSLLGAYRLEEDVLDARPDLTFVEFAVNDNGQASLTAESPKAIPRTLASIISRLREQNPNMAVVMPLSPHRVLEGSSHSAFGKNLDLSREQSRQAADRLRVPWIDLQQAFSERLETNPGTPSFYAGSDTPGNYVHPAPAGHQTYADAVIKTLGTLFASHTFDFSKPEGGVALRPYPEFPQIVSASTLAPHAPGWKVETSENANAPILSDRPCLISSEPGKALEYSFEGTAIALWCSTRSRGAMDVELDGKPLGRYTSQVQPAGKFTGRFSPLSDSLDPAKRHTIRLVPVATPGVPSPRIFLYALALDSKVSNQN